MASTNYKIGQDDNVTDYFKLRSPTRTISYVLPYLTSTSMTLLDVGCGPGSITVGLARLLPDGHVVGIDESSEAVDKARALAAQEGVTNVTFRIGNALDLAAAGIEPASFDVVHAHQCLVHLSDPLRGLREMRRAARRWVATRDNFRGVRVSHPETELGVRFGNALTEAHHAWQGEKFDVGRHLVQWALEAGWKREQITFSTSAELNATPDTRQAIQRAVVHVVAKQREGWVGRGTFSEEELDQLLREYEVWRDREDAFMAIYAGEIVCAMDEQ